MGKYVVLVALVCYDCHGPAWRRATLRHISLTYRHLAQAPHIQERRSSDVLGFLIPPGIGLTPYLSCGKYPESRVVSRCRLYGSFAVTTSTCSCALSPMILLSFAAQCKETRIFPLQALRPAHRQLGIKPQLVRLFSSIPSPASPWNSPLAPPLQDGMLRVTSYNV